MDAQGNHEVGDTLRLRNFRHYLNDGKSWREQKVTKGLVLVVQILGAEPLAIKSEEECLNIAEVLDMMGWEPKDKKLKKTIQKELAELRKKRQSKTEQPKPKPAKKTKK